MTIFRRLSTVAVVLSTLTLLLSVACTREVVKEVPVDRIVEVEVIKEVPVEKEVIKEIPVEKIIETTITEFVEKTVEVEVAVPVPAKGYVHQALEPFPKSGGVLNTAWGHLVPHWDIHQGPAGQPFLGSLVNMYDGLIRRNPNDGMLGIVPQLANSWEFSEDGTTYTFHLEQNVKFHDGSDFTSEDVVATFNRIINPPDNIAITISEAFRPVDSVTAVDDHTVEFQLKSPTSWQFGVFALPGATVYDKGTLEAHNGEFKGVSLDQLPGTGPFKFKDYVQGEYLMMENFGDYWNDQLPYLDGIKHLHVRKGTDRAIAVITGQADMTWNGSVDGYREALKNPDIVSAAQMPVHGAGFAYFNTSKAPFNDPRVMKAFNLAINRHDMIAVMQGSGSLSRWLPLSASGVTPEATLLTLPYYKVENSDDIEAAKALMAEAGYPGGEGFPTISYAAEGGNLDEAIIDQLKTNLGVDIEYKTLERSLVAGELEGDFDIVRFLVYVSHLRNPAPYLRVMHGKGGSQNYGGYDNPEFDAALDEMDAELDPLKLGAIVQKAQQLLDDNPPGVMPSGFGFHRLIWRNDVKGMPFGIRKQAIWDRLDTVWLDR